MTIPSVPLTMKMAKKSHRYYTDLADAKAGGRAEEFIAQDFCGMWMDHLDEYDPMILSCHSSKQFRRI